MGKPASIYRSTYRLINKRYRGHFLNWNISVRKGIENNSDSLSSGERKGNSLNPEFTRGVAGPPAFNGKKLQTFLVAEGPGSGTP